MTRKHRIVVSAENSAYMGWQCKLFHFSCVTRTGYSPLFLVHDTGRPLHPDFYEVVRAGATVRRVPSYARNDFGHYVGRNIAGSLRHAAALCAADEFIVLCDPDLLFVRKPSFPARLSASQYLNVDFADPRVGPAAERLGIEAPEHARSSHLRCGTPYVVPGRHARQIAEMWLQAIDALIPPIWMNAMYGFALAMLKLRMDVAVTDFVDGNFQSQALCTRDIVHYGWSDQHWNKRDYLEPDRAMHVWDPPADAASGSIAHEIFSQIREARDFYRAGGAYGLGQAGVESHP